MQIIDCFVTGLLTHQVDPKLADKIENLLVSKLPSLKYKGGIKTDFFENERIVSIHELKDLKKEIFKGVNYYNQNTWKSSRLKNVDILQYWVQDYNQNEVHPRHTHGKNEISAVYWVRANEEAGKFYLYSPVNYCEMYFSGIVKPENSNKYNSKLLSITPKKGQLILFPASMEHEVIGGGPNCIRTTIAFNLDVPHNVYNYKK